MKKDYVQRIILVFGVLFFAIGILSYYNGFQTSGFAGIFWFSYTALVLIGIGILTKNPYLIGSQLNIILIPYIVWNIDFFYVLLTNESLLGITNYFFTLHCLLSYVGWETSFYRKLCNIYNNKNNGR